MCISNLHHCPSTGTRAPALGDKGSWGQLGQHRECALCHHPPWSTPSSQPTQSLHSLLQAYSPSRSPELPRSPAAPCSLHETLWPTPEPFQIHTAPSAPHYQTPFTVPGEPPPPQRPPSRSTDPTPCPSRRLPAFRDHHRPPLPPPRLSVQPHSPKDLARRRPPAPPLAAPALKALRSPAAALPRLCPTGVLNGFPSRNSILGWQQTAARRPSLLLPTPPWLAVTSTNCRSLCWAWPASLQPIGLCS